VAAAEPYATRGEQLACRGADQPRATAAATARRLRNSVIPIRSVAYNDSSAGVPAWLTAERNRPRVYLTLGTVSYGAVEVLNRAAAGIGRALENDAQRPGAISEAVQALLGDSAERQAACRVRDEIVAMPSPSEVVPELVELANRAA
jgi:UDP:flavonoid glycosyltransferase YjiC (YdhE family)